LIAWAQLLHLYQPPTQTHDVLVRIAEESYRPLLGVLRQHPAARVAININAVLTQLLAEHGLGDVIESMRELAERGQVEFVGSGRYHPILPLIPAPLRRRSIVENAHVNRELIGPVYRPRGFFPPEMCYSADLAFDVHETGHEWVLLSGVAAPDTWPTTDVARIPVPNGAASRSVGVFFRDDLRSNRISFSETTPASFLQDIGGRTDDGDRYVVTAMDAETFGHHIKGWEQRFLAAAYAQAARPDSGIEMVTPSEVLDRFPTGPEVHPRPSSWSTTNEDIAAGAPFPLWHAPWNPTHALQWEYVHHCLWLVEMATHHVQTAEGRKAASYADTKLQPALHSCPFCLASRRPWWNVTLIGWGLLLVQETILHAIHAIRIGDVPHEIAQQAEWRFAAASDVRARLERAVYLEGPAA
jgi:hypothetical protein